MSMPPCPWHDKGRNSYPVCSRRKKRDINLRCFRSRWKLKLQSETTGRKFTAWLVGEGGASCHRGKLSETSFLGPNRLLSIQNLWRGWALYVSFLFIPFDRACCHQYYPKEAVTTCPSPYISLPPCPQWSTRYLVNSYKVIKGQSDISGWILLPKKGVLLHPVK